MTFKITLFFVIGMFFLIKDEAFGQKKIKVEETMHSYSIGKHKSLKVIIFDADEEMVKKVWIKKMKAFKAKVSKKGDEIFADNALIKNISENTIDIYAQTKFNNDGNIVLFVAFNLGGAYLNSSDHPDMYKKAVKLMENFSKDISIEILEGKIKEREKILKKHEKEKEELEKRNERLKKDIENCKERINKNEKEIEDNKKQIEEKKQVLENEIKEIEALKIKLKKIE